MKHWYDKKSKDPMCFVQFGVRNGKKELKEKDDEEEEDNNDINQSSRKTTTQSTTDPDCGMFYKGEHKK